MHADRSAPLRAPSRRALLVALAGVAASPGALGRRGYPERPITLVVPFASGGIADLTARVVARTMSSALGQPIVIDNRPGAGGIVATQAVVRAAPDGYTALLLSNANAISASLFRRLPFDVTRDLAPVGTLGFFDLVLCVDRDSPLRTLPDLLAHARAHPGKLTIGTIAIGSTQHLAAELFQSRAGIDAVIVPYKGTPAVLGALRGGEIDLAFEILGPALPQIAGGALRPLAVSAARRNRVLPTTPTVQEAGVADYDVASWNALAAPAGTPQPVVVRLNAAIRDALAVPAVAQRLLEMGVRPQAGTPVELEALLASEIRRWRAVIVAAGITPQ
ncbi:MAG: tripartite tricarboxylate transporter substrate binding protein [Burkholderiaceae bacterium]|nr:tripartite tricarboxylate transporter substrate binding protein [Burkholderiaceae bacterium]